MAPSLGLESGWNRAGMQPLKSEHIIPPCVLRFLDGLEQWEKILNAAVLILAQHQIGVPADSVTLISTFGAYVDKILLE